MEFLLFVVFSSLESLAIFALMFALFRFEYKFYHNSVIFISAVLSFVSYSLRLGFDLAFLGPIANILLIFAFLYYIFQIQIFYAGIMTITGFLAFGITQFIVFLLLDLSGIATFGSAKPNNFEGYLVQFLTSLAAFGITYFIKRKNYGFAYVPHGQRAFVHYKGLNRLFLYLMIIGTVVASVMVITNIEKNIYLHLSLAALLIIIFIVIIYLSIKKEYSND